MARRSAAALCAWLCCTTCAAPRTLVVLDDLSYRSSHAEFFSQLESRGHALSFAAVGSAEARLSELGEWLFDGLVLVAPRAEELGPELDAGAVAEFIDAGRSVFVGGGCEVGFATREVAAEVGLEFDAEERVVIDHAAFDVKDHTKDDDHTLIVADAFTPAAVMVGAAPQPVLYRGAGMRLADENELVLSVLTGAATTYSWSTLDEVDAAPAASGAELLLVAAMQARNNARVVVCGSWDMMSDEFFALPAQKFHAKGPNPSGNRAFASNITAWLFDGAGSLRLSEVQHQLVGGGAQSVYTIKEEVSFGFTVEVLEEGGWAPFVADDLQMEFTMLDPYYRLFVPHVGQGRYNVSFVLPDVNGVFQFRLDYRRVGYTHLQSSTQVNVPPPRHDGYARFLPVRVLPPPPRLHTPGPPGGLGVELALLQVAYPYYVSALSMMGGFWLFSVAWLSSA